MRRADRLARARGSLQASGSQELPGLRPLPPEDDAQLLPMHDFACSGSGMKGDAWFRVCAFWLEMLVRGRPGWLGCSGVCPGGQ